MPIFIVFGLTRPGIEPVSTVSVADALSTRPLISFFIDFGRHCNDIFICSLSFARQVFHKALFILPTDDCDL